MLTRGARALRRQRASRQASTASPYPGFGDRLREALRDAGYWNAQRSRADISRFCRDNGWLTQYIYEYLRATRMPAYAQLTKLAADLQVPLAWLLVGEEGCEELLRFRRRRKRRKARLPDRR